MSAPPYMTDSEISEICEPLSQPAAQHRFLASLGLVVSRKPSGRPLVGRSEFERAMAPRVANELHPRTAQPDIAGLADFFKRGRNGAKTKGQ